MSCSKISHGSKGFFQFFYILSDSTMLRATHSKNGKITEAAKKVGRAIFFLDMPWHRQPSFENVPSDSKLHSSNRLKEDFKKVDDDDTEQGSLKPDIYTTPDPRFHKTEPINWQEVNKFFKARRMQNYPSLWYWWNPAVVLSGNVRQRHQNRPERWKDHVLKDKIIYQFREKEDLDAWYTTTDHMMNGHSWSELTQSKNGKTIAFRGYINQKMPSDRLPIPGMTYVAHAYMQTKPWVDGSHVGLMQIDNYDKVVLRVRGDGRKYHFVMFSDHHMGEVPQHEYSVFKAPFQTNGGPVWQKIEIPLSKFLPYKDHMFKTSGLNYANLKDHFLMRAATRIQWIRIEMLEKNSGPFQLEIDYIAMAKDMKEQLLDGRIGIDPSDWRNDIGEKPVKTSVSPYNAAFPIDGAPGSRFDDKNDRMKKRAGAVGVAIDYWDTPKPQEKKGWG